MLVLKTSCSHVLKYLKLFIYSAKLTTTLMYITPWHLWLLKCCKNKNLYDMKIYFYLIKINLYSIKYIFIISTFFDDVKIYFYLIKIILCSVRNIFIPFFFFFFFFFIQVKYINIIWNFYWKLFWWAYLVFYLYLQKFDFYFQCVNWTIARGCGKPAKKDIIIL